MPNKIRKKIVPAATKHTLLELQVLDFASNNAYHCSHRMSLCPLLYYQLLASGGIIQLNPQLKISLNCIQNFVPPTKKERKKEIISLVQLND